MKAETFEKIITVDDYLDRFCDICLFTDKCKLCPVYGKTWSCPPFSFDLLDYWHDYHSLIVICRKLIMDDDDKESYKKSYIENFIHDIPSDHDWTSESGKLAAKGLIRSGGDGDRFNINKMIDGSIAGLSEELISLQEIYPESHALSPGRCLLCAGHCARAEGKPCRFPDRMHHSLESMGADIGKTVTEMFGLELQWIQNNNELPDYFVQVGGLLIKE